MKKILLLSVLAILACSSDLFAQDYMKMRKKQLRIEYQKKVDSLNLLSKEVDSLRFQKVQIESYLADIKKELIYKTNFVNNINQELVLSRDSLRISVSKSDVLFNANQKLKDSLSFKIFQNDSLFLTLDKIKSDLILSRDSISNYKAEKRISDTYNNSKGVSHWRQISNSESDINELDVTIQNKPLEVSMCSPGQILFFYDKAVIDGDRFRLKKRGNLIILTDSAGQSIRFLIKGDEMVLKVYDKTGDLSFSSILKEASENRYN